jgi:thymidylate kinase
MAGTYIVFEGPDYVGKSTLTTNVNKKLEEAGVPNLATRHPGATPLGRLLRIAVKNPDAFLDQEPYNSDEKIVVDPQSAQTLRS